MTETDTEKMDRAVQLIGKVIVSSDAMALGAEIMISALIFSAAAGATHIGTSREAFLQGAADAIDYIRPPH